ncbi:hypothetical protein D3C80_831140 [compost metagenome]
MCMSRSPMVLEISTFWPVALTEPAGSAECAWLPLPSLRVISPALLRPDCQAPLLTSPTAEILIEPVFGLMVLASRAATDT